MVLSTVILGTLVAGWLTVTTSQLQDPLLEKLVGKWHIHRAFSNRTAENVATVEWVVDHRYLRIIMRDPNKPPKYEAHVYITFEKEAKRYAIHWMDVFAGSLPETMGYGHQAGDSIVFEWKDGEGTLRNTFTWLSSSKSWTSKIEQTNKEGEWTTFCTDTYTRK
ncbi:MAG: DUF1579 family protein [Armatimonadetes bacterium]|nr:DUF1579 family protein [Armatimonadota bacterium]